MSVEISVTGNTIKWLRTEGGSDIKELRSPAATTLFTLKDNTDVFEIATSSCYLEDFTFAEVTIPAAANAAALLNLLNAFVPAAGGGGAGDMTKAVYDPTNVAGDAFDMDNMVEGVTSKILTADERNEFTEAYNGWIGAVVETQATTVTEAAGTVSLNLEQSGGGDLTLVTSTGLVNFDATPIATVALTLGSDISPQTNYVFIPEATNTLTANTTGFPVAEHVPIANVLVQSSAGVSSDGVYKLHAWVDHIQLTANNGHVSHINSWVRSQPATWIDGTLASTSVGVATFDVATTSGNVLQLHSHTQPAFNTATGSDIFVVNDSATAFKKVGNLSAELTDSLGVTMSNRRYNMVIWSVVSENGVDSKLMCNLPDASYSVDSLAINDAEKTSNFNIPVEFKGTGFLIARLTVRHQSGSNTFSILQNEDLRGQFPSTFAGGTAATTTNFPDNAFTIFDETDNSKILNFQASGITTATTRTVTMADKNVDLGGVMYDGGDATGANRTYGSTDAFGITFKTNNLEVIRINNAQQVGINKAASDALDVDGNINTDEDYYRVGNIIIHQTGSADNYFFGLNVGSAANALTEECIGVGISVMDGILQAKWNACLGHEAGQDMEDGNDNTFLGWHAGRVVVDEDDNTVVGSGAFRLANGNNNTVMGVDTAGLMDGDGNTIIGHGAADDNFSSGGDNVALGINALDDMTTGSDNTMLGSNTGILVTTGSANVFIGHDAGSAEAVGISDTLFIENTSSSTPLIYGEFDTELLRFSGAYGAMDVGADPADPPNGAHALFQSDGVGSGDDGDLMIKITDSGGTTKTITLVDYSAF